MKNKRGSLGITEIVAIVLAIAVLAFGLSFIKTQSLKGEKLLSGEIDARTLESSKSVLEAELIDKEMALSKTSSDVFLVGVKNAAADNTEILLEVISGTATDAAEWFVYKASPAVLKANERYYYTVKLNIPDTAESSDYIFDINIMSSGKLLESQNILVGVR